ncbi:MAG: alpha/beta fold hydrolase [Burkholderiales bacterium]
MTLPASLPPAITSRADATAIEAAAERIETPCGDQSMVWHVWGGSGEGAPIVLLHGGAGSWTHWVRNIGPLVAAGRKVLAPDLPGFGDSAKPPAGHDADAMTQWIERGLQQLIGTELCDVAGFSFGGMVAGFLAAEHPERVRRLVLVGAEALIADPGRRLHLRSWSHLAEGPERDAAMAHNLKALMVAREATIDELTLTLHSENLVRDRMPRRRISKTDVLLRTLPRVRCPVWGIWGEFDALYRDRPEVIEPALAQAPGFQSLITIAGAGHWVQFEDAQGFNRALLAALT